MFRKPLLALFAVVALQSGCIINSTTNNNQNRSPGDVTFKWTFGGLSCADLPEVETVKISIPGELLENDGVYPCTQAGVDGITLHDFAGKGYTYTVDAFTYSHERAFTANGSFTIDGNMLENVDLTPVGVPPSYAILYWTFPASSSYSNPNCAQAGVTHVDVSIDGSAYIRYPCEAGQSQAGAKTPYLLSGSHTVFFRATYVDATHDDGYYYFDGGMTTQVGGSVQSYDLKWFGGAKVSWLIYDNGTQRTCAQAGIETVYVNFKDGNGNFVYPGSGDPRPCNEISAYYNELIPDSYKVYLSARATNNSVWDNGSTAPFVTVYAGEFKGAGDASTPLFLDYRSAQ